MKKMIFALLFCSLMAVVCACTMREEASTDPAEPAPAVCNEQVNILEAPAMLSPDAQQAHPLEMPVTKEINANVPAPTVQAKIEDETAMAEWTVSPRENPEQPVIMQEKEPVIAVSHAVPIAWEVEAVEPVDTQEQDIAPTVCVSATDRSPIPKQSPAPGPKISVDFVITCPPEPSPAPEVPDFTEPPDTQPSATPIIPDTQATPVLRTPSDLVSEPESESAPTSTPEPAASPKPGGGYAVCSCGNTILPNKLVAHMKAHALNGESHSYVAY